MCTKCQNTFDFKRMIYSRCELDGRERKYTKHPKTIAQRVHCAEFQQIPTENGRLKMVGTIKSKTFKLFLAITMSLFLTFARLMLLLILDERRAKLQQQKKIVQTANKLWTIMTSMMRWFEMDKYSRPNDGFAACSIFISCSKSTRLVGDFSAMHN